MKPQLISMCLFISLFPVLSANALAQQPIKLPQPSLVSDTSVEKAIAGRRSVRTYKDEPLQLRDLAQILWAAQGITEPSRGLRAAPSPRAAYLIRVYIAVGNVVGLGQGLYRYEPKGHEVVRLIEGDQKAVLYETAGQGPIKKAAAALVITGDSAKSTNPAWTCLEAGHVAENVYLQCVSMRLGTVAMAGFKPDRVRRALALPEKEEVIYVMPLGKL